MKNWFQLSIGWLMDSIKFFLVIVVGRQFDLCQLWYVNWVCNDFFCCSTLESSISNIQLHFVLNGKCDCTQMTITDRIRLARKEKNLVGSKHCRRQSITSSNENRCRFLQTILVPNIICWIVLSLIRMDVRERPSQKWWMNEYSTSCAFDNHLSS